MGRGIDWFKDYRIEKLSVVADCPYHTDFRLQLLDTDGTSHSYGNVSIVWDLFEKITGKIFPTLPYEECIDSEDYKLDLIEPSEMVKLCDMVLSDNRVDEVHMRDRFEWFKKLSEQGYYIAYDCE